MPSVSSSRHLPARRRGDESAPPAETTNTEQPFYAFTAEVPATSRRDMPYSMSAPMDRSQLERMSSRELHDRAVSVARKHVDIGFLWSLVKAVPVAHAAEGHVGEADADIARVSALLNDLLHAGEGDVAEGLRPLYIDYLETHG
jgi:hypothetical protein